jgi:hypothetical protein
MASESHFSRIQHLYETKQHDDADKEKSFENILLDLFAPAKALTNELSCDFWILLNEQL